MGSFAALSSMQSERLHPRVGPSSFALFSTHQEPVFLVAKTVSPVYILEEIIDVTTYKSVSIIIGKRHVHPINLVFVIVAPVSLFGNSRKIIFYLFIFLYSI